MKPIDSIKPLPSSPAIPKPIRPVSGPPVSSSTAPPPNLLADFDRVWAKAQIDSARKIRALRPESRELVELQVTVNQLGVGTQILTQAAESVNGTIRRVQQLGAN